MPMERTDGSAPPSNPIILESEFMMFDGSTLGALDFINHKFLPYKESVAPEDLINCETLDGNV